MNSLRTTSELENALFLATQGERYAVSNLSKKDTCSFFQVDDPYFGLSVNSFQQGEINIDLRVSLFQQREFDT